MSSKLKTLSPGRRAVPRAGFVAAIGRACNAVALRAGIFVFLAVLMTAAGADKTTWMKYNNVKPGTSDTTNWGKGRIPLGTGGQGDYGNIHSPVVIKDGSTNKMWYSGNGVGGWRIYYATSLDGLTWTKYNNDLPGDTNTTSTDGRIPQGTAGTGDENHAFRPCVIKDDSTYKMWYGGRDGGDADRIYHATSSDGLTWTKYSNSIPPDSNTTGTNGRIPLGTSGGDTAGIYGASVIKDGSTYKMWYSGSDGTNRRIYHAFSPDGLTWTKYTNAVPGNTNTTSTLGRIPLGTSGGDTDDVAFPGVIKVRSTYKMWYSGYDGSTWRIYYATSTNGLTWKKYDNSIPDDSDTTSSNGCIPLGIIGGSGGDTNGVITPCVIKDGYTYKVWYGGRGKYYRIYHATLDALPEGLIFYSH